MRGKTTRARGAAATVAVLAGLALTGCSSSDQAGNTAGVGTIETGTPVSQPAPPPPMTGDETAWLAGVKSYEHRFTRHFGRSGLLTESSIRQSIAIDDGCKAALRKAGDPGRLKPARTLARSACQALHAAAADYRHMLGLGVLYGSVIYGDSSAFEQLMKSASRHEGAGIGRLSRAVARAKEIKAQIDAAAAS